MLIFFVKFFSFLLRTSSYSGIMLSNKIYGGKQMRVRATKTANTVQYAIIKDINKNGKRTTCVYENIENFEKLKLKAGDKGGCWKSSTKNSKLEKIFSDLLFFSYK